MSSGIVRSLVPETSEFDLTYLCTTDISALQYHFVKDSGTDIVKTGAGEKSVGVLMNAPNLTTQGKLALVRTGGLAKVKTGAGTNVGDFLKADTNGAAVAASSNDEYNAYALDGGANGDTIIVLVCHGKTP